jgi:hypothetical protein
MDISYYLGIFAIVAGRVTLVALGFVFLAMIVVFITKSIRDYGIYQFSGRVFIFLLFGVILHYPIYYYFDYFKKNETLQFFIYIMPSLFFPVILKLINKFLPIKKIEKKYQ